MTAVGEIVLVSQSSELWELPGGRPEVNEDWRATLDREVMEEVCAKVPDTFLPGFSRGVCMKGHEEGLVLVRAMWRADVELLSWEPLHEMRERRLVDPDEALTEMSLLAGLGGLYRHLITNALVVSRDTRLGGS